MGEFPSLPCLTAGATTPHVHCPQFAADSRAATSRQGALTETSLANRRPRRRRPLAGKAIAGKTHPHRLLEATCSVNVLKTKRRLSAPNDLHNPPGGCGNEPLPQEQLQSA